MTTKQTPDVEISDEDLDHASGGFTSIDILHSIKSKQIPSFYNAGGAATYLHELNKQLDQGYACPNDRIRGRMSKGY